MTIHTCVVIIVAIQGNSSTIKTASYCLRCIIIKAFSKVFLIFFFCRAGSSNLRTLTRTTYRQSHTNARCCRCNSTRSAWATTRSNTARCMTTTTCITSRATTTPRRSPYGWSQTYHSRATLPPKELLSPGTFAVDGIRCNRCSKLRMTSLRCL